MIGSAAEPYDVLVIGGGMSGLSAACQAAALGATVACAEPGLFGGLVASVGEIDDFPAAQRAPGASLADAYHQRARELGVTFLATEVASLACANGGIVAQVTSGVVVARTAIVASGASMRSLDLPREAQFVKRGLSDCAWCDGGLYRGKAVAVIGGGDSALQAALYLARQCSRVSLVMRDALPRARRSYLLAAADEPKIEFMWETVVEEFIGEDHVQGLQVRNSVDGSTLNLQCECVFVYIGLEPSGLPVATGLALDDQGYIVIDNQMQTSIRGIYAAGAVRSGHGGSIANALSDGEMAAAAAVRSMQEAG